MTAPSNANTSGLPDACAQEEADTLASKLTNAEIIAASWKDRATAAEARADRLAKELEWYGEQSRLARLIHSEGDAGRNAIASDGGKRARAALQQETQP